MTACMQLVHEGCGTGHITVGGADDDLRKQCPRNRLGWGPPRTLSGPIRGITSRCELEDEISAVRDSSDLVLMSLGQESDREGELVS